jgi:hypothetical protein
MPALGAVRLMYSLIPSQIVTTLDAYATAPILSSALPFCVRMVYPLHRLTICLSNGVVVEPPASKRSTVIAGYRHSL